MNINKVIDRFEQTHDDDLFTGLVFYKDENRVVAECFLKNMSNVRFDVQEMKIKGQSAVTFKSLSTPGETAIDGANITTGYLSADRISGGFLSSKNNDLRFNLNSGILGVYDNDRLLCTTLKMKENKS